MALDTNILVCAEEVNDAHRGLHARTVLASLETHQLVIPVQVLGEVFTVLRRKTTRPPARIVQDILRWQNVSLCVPTTAEILVRAGDLITYHSFNLWDAVIFAASAEAGSRVLLSEDMQDGFAWGGVTLINPFHPAGLARMQALIG